MNKNQFFYKRREVRAPKEGEEGPQFKEFTDSFNLEKVIRTLELEDGRLSVALEDTHERIQHDVPVKNSQGKTTGYKNERYTHQSIITLDLPDVARFKAVSEAVVIL